MSRFQALALQRTLPSSDGPAAVVELFQVQWHRTDGTPLWAAPVSLTLRGERVGLVGANGSGKSVLLDLLLGRRLASSGRVVCRGVWHLVSQDVCGQVGQTVAALAGLEVPLQALARLARGDGTAADLELVGERWDLAATLAQTLASLGIECDALDTADRLSDGQRMRIALAGAWLSGAEAVALDEPTNHLDHEGREALIRQVRRYPGALLIASHDRRLLREMDRIIEVSPQGLTQHGGGYGEYRARRDALQRSLQDALEHAKAHRDAVLRELQRRHDTQQRRLAQGRRQAGEANLSRIVIDGRRAQAQRTQARQQRLMSSQSIAAHAAVAEAAARVLHETDVALALDGSRMPPSQRLLSMHALVCRHALPSMMPWSLALQGPRRIALRGPNGCGKTTLLRTLTGQYLPASGGAGLHVPWAWLDQQAVGCLADGMSAHGRCEARIPDAQREGGPVSPLRCLEELGGPLTLAQLRTRAACLGLSAAVLERDASLLSGGERMRLALACALWRADPPRLLILDEPTNHLDLAAVESLQNALAAFPGALIVASHDEDVLEALRCDIAWTWAPEGWQCEPLISA